MFPRDPACDGKSETGPIGSAPCGFATKESLKNAGQVLPLDSDSRVLDNERRNTLVQRDAHANFTAPVGELHGVVEKDHDQLTGERGITYGRSLLEFLDRHFDPFLSGDNACRA